jgi:hypothetical protein
LLVLPLSRVSKQPIFFCHLYPVELLAQTRCQGS